MQHSKDAYYKAKDKSKHVSVKSDEKSTYDKLDEPVRMSTAARSPDPFPK